MSSKLSQLRARVADQGRNFAKVANLNATVTPPGSDVTDHDEKGGVSAKSDPDGSGTTAGKPSDAVGGPSNPNSDANPNGVSDATLVANPSASGEASNVKTQDGNAIDDRANDSALKSAAKTVVNATTILERFRNGGKAAAATPTSTPTATPAADAPKQAGTDSSDAIVTSGDLSSYKMAAAIQLVDALAEVEGGIEFGVEMIQRKMGRDAAIGLMSNALAERNAVLDGENVKLAAVKVLNDEYNDLMSKVASALNEPQNGPRLQKLAAAIAANTEQYANDPDGLQKTAHFLQGTKFAAAMMDPAAMAGAEAEAGAPPEAAGGEAPPSSEEIQQIVQMLVEQGLISPEEAPQLIAELTGGAPAGAPPEAGAGGMPPEGGPPAEEGAKAAKAAAALVG